MSVPRLHGGLNSRLYRLAYAVKAAVYVQIGEPQNPDMVLCEKLCAQTVGLLLLGRVMLCPVQFDDSLVFAQ